ncbi:hypothetical protein ACVOA5_15580, partial [Shigella flexneri]
PRQPSGKNIIRWLLKKRTNGSVRYCQYTSVYEWQKDVDLHQVLWSRSRLGERPKGQGITGADHFWFGHTPLRHRVDIGNLHYIDTGAVFGG